MPNVFYISLAAAAVANGHATAGHCQGVSQIHSSTRTRIQTHTHTHTVTIAVKLPCWVRCVSAFLSVPFYPLFVQAINNLCGNTFSAAAYLPAVDWDSAAVRTDSY